MNEFKTELLKESIKTPLGIPEDASGEIITDTSGEITRGKTDLFE